MYIHEHQAKELLAEAGVPIPKGHVLTSVEELEAIWRDLGGGPCVIKAQIHAGGRGKAGGVRVCHALPQAREAVESLLNRPLVTHQTGPAGRIVRRLYIEQGVEIEREIYLGLLLDRDRGQPVFMVSAAGGMDIEEIAATRPQDILTLPVHPLTGAASHLLRRMGFFLGLTGEALRAFSRLAAALYELFLNYDASLLELNPLVQTRDGGLLALDAKLSVDDNALYRQPRIVAFRDRNEEDPRETEAEAHGLNYIALEGSIGCMVNGAGLAMATMDMIHLKGAEPANFLDVGGGVTAEAVREAFHLLFTDEQVQGILVNIFGGIVRCDIIAQGLLDALREAPQAMRVPVVMRLVGTHEEEGRRMIRDAGVNVIWADDLDAAATRIVQAVNEQEARA